MTVELLFVTNKEYETHKNVDDATTFRYYIYERIYVHLQKNVQKFLTNTLSSPRFFTKSEIVREATLTNNSSTYNRVEIIYDSKRNLNHTLVLYFSLKIVF